MPDRKCDQVTKAGKPCPTAPVTGYDQCMGHLPPEVKAELGFGGSHGGGRPRRPREIELIQEVAEEFKSQLRAVYSDGLTAERAVVVGNGPTAEVQMVPDHPHRLKTASEMNDRLHGRARQSLEMSGPEGRPIATTVITDPDIAEAARDVLRRTAASSGD